MHKLKIIVLFGLISLVAVFSNAFADEEFILSDIRVEGLHRISRETVLNYAPVSLGHKMHASQTGAVIRALYDTGFFKDVAVSRQGNVLVIRVVERPTISKITVSGNKMINKEQLDTVLRDTGLVEGRVFSPAVFEKFKQGLLNEYYQTGHYNARVDATTTDEPRQRVALNINISEGRIAQVQQINIIGNRVFTTKQLVKDMPLGKPGLFSFFTREDQYSKEKLNASLEVLRNYYLDRGYIKFKVESHQVLLTPDKKNLYVVIRVSEGDLYKVKGVRLAGKMPLPEAKLRSFIRIKEGDVFSRQSVMKSTSAMSKALGNNGYTFANINVVPDIDDANKQVMLTFYVEPGMRVYVRRIRFTGNAQTAEHVLRRQTRQMEGSLASAGKIKKAVQRLKMLGYIKEADVATHPVPGYPDQIDVEYKVTETPPATATGAVSYGTDGFGFSGSVNNTNFLGTGKTVGIAVDKRPLVRTYRFDYLNPYYTVDGVKRGFSLYSQRYTPGAINLENYTYDNYGGVLHYTIPISAKNDNLQFGIGYQRTFLHIGSHPAAELQQFVNDNGSDFNQALVNLGWERNNFNRAFFPTQGLNQNAFVNFWLPAGKAGDSQTLGYYKASYNARWYYPLTKSEKFLITLLVGGGYGDGLGRTEGLPFFQNYYAGGVGYTGVVRGYATNSLGPRDSLGNPLGGNLQGAGSVGFVFPNPISPENLRTSLFVDAGNVYNTRSSTTPIVGLSNPNSGPMRFSAGVSAEWRLPLLGVITLSVARAINPQQGDNLDFFQFNLGTSF